MTERCYRLANNDKTVDVRGDPARDALVGMGYGLVAEVDCESGTITSQADLVYVERGVIARAEFESLPEAEKRALRRAAGGVQVASAFPQSDTKWD